MAPGFCMNCGNALVPGSRFCMSCGSAVPTPGASGAMPSPVATPDTASGTPPPLAPPPPPPPVPQFNPQGPPGPGGVAGLSSSLGLQGQRSFLVQHQYFSQGHSYRVLDPQKRHLFTVQGNWGQVMQADSMREMVGSIIPSSYLGRVAARSVDMSYSLVGPQGNVCGMVQKQGRANTSVFTVTDLQGQPALVITVQRGMMGGLTATAVFPDGRPMMQTQGNLVGHTFMIRDPAGADLAKVHESWASTRDTYNLDLVGNIDPVFPLVYAILIDYEKGK